MGIAIGIDLGTTNTVCAAVRDGRATTIADEKGRKLLPSVVSFHPSGTVLVGDPAKERRLIDAANTIYSVKRLIGKSWKNPEVQIAKSRFPFELKEGAKESTMVVARGESYALPEISAFVLRRAKAMAEAALGETVDKAVITVPANFNDLQRASTKVAGKLAGLEVLRILNEPTAAALAYGQSITQAERIAVYDLGGGTFDITLLDLSGSVFEVLSTGGDSSLGGDDIDIAIAEKMADSFMRAHRYDPRSNNESFGRLRIYAEQLKHQLSIDPIAGLEIKNIAFGEGGVALTHKFSMSRDDLEKISDPLIERTIIASRKAIESVKIDLAALDRVILVGGSTRMPLVARKVEAFFKLPPHLRVNPDEVVALGAAIQASSLTGNRRTTQVAADSQANIKASRYQGDEQPTRKTMRPLAGAPPQAGPGSRKADPSPIIPGVVTGARAAPANVPELAGAIVSARGVSKRVDPRADPDDDSPPIVSPRTKKAAPEPQVQAKARDVNTTKAGPPPQAQQQPPPQKRAEPKPEPKPEPKADPSELSFSRAAPDLRFSLPPVPNQVEEPELPPPPSVPPPPVQQPAAAARAPDFALPELPAAPPPQAAPPPRIQPYQPPPKEARPQQQQQRPPQQQARPAPPGRAAPLLIDVTPLSLSVETVGGYCDVLIAANSPIPCDRTRVFMTGSDNQTQVFVRVAQGESNKFAENVSLGSLELSGLRAAPRGELKIGVTFEIDADGILQVSARDEATGKKTQARMRVIGAHTEQADVDEMMKRQARHDVQ